MRRTGVPFLVLLLTAVAALATGCARRVPAVDPAAEAERLYKRATDAVANVTEGEYSYSYIQFHWSRANDFLNWIERVYPETPTGQALRAGTLKIGPFEPGYFRGRVLAKLEEKQNFAFDAVNATIFLYERPGAWPADTRRAALARIIEVLCVQQRWREAIDFPAEADGDAQVLAASVVRIAARQGRDDIVKEMIEAARTQDRPALHLLVARGMAERGAPRDLLARFLEEHPAEDVRLAVLEGMVDREIAIRRAASLGRSPDSALVNGERVKNPEVRDEIETETRNLVLPGNPRAAVLLGRYRAALGDRPPTRTEIGAISAYIDHLVAFERAEEIEQFAWAATLSAADRRELELLTIRAYAQAGLVPKAEAARDAFKAARPTEADAAVAAFYRGRFLSDLSPFVVREDTFAGIPISNPHVLAVLICDWQFSPNRQARGAAPWDALVFKLDPGFTNLPEPKSREVQKAVGTSRPY